MLSLAIALHVLAAIVWVGGMFFMLLCLRPSLGQVNDPVQRLALIRATLQRFFPWVWCAVLVLPVTGFWMTVTLYPGVTWPWSIWVMLILGILMILIFLYVYFGTWRQLRQALANSDRGAAVNAVESIRKLVTVNLVFGIIVAVVASGGRYL